MTITTGRSVPGAGSSGAVGFADAAGNLVALSAYRKQLGRSKATLWRWRKHGWLETVNVLGKLYLTREVIAAFETKVLSGELAKQPHGCAA